MLIFVKNTPRAYAWGSRDALPNLLGVEPSGEPQAELWLGDHPGAPAAIAKGGKRLHTLIDLIESDPEQYGVNGGHLPFLMKVLAIGAPLSLQVHPNKAQAEAGFAREEAAGVPADARERNYGDPNHKPELLVALSEVSALCGFRPLADARHDLLALAAAVEVAAGAAADAVESVESADAAAGGAALRHAASLLEASEQAGAEARQRMLEWALGGGDEPKAAVRAIAHALEQGAPPAIDRARAWALRKITAGYPEDAGALVSLLLHLATLRPGEAVYLGAQQLHAYLDGIAVEVMAASDNVLRAGLTEKHVDVAELMSIVDFGSLDSPLIEPVSVRPGLVRWQPDVADFQLLRATLRSPEHDAPFDGGFGGEDQGAETVLIDAPYPLVLLVTEGRVRVDRVGGDLVEFASVAHGQSLYVSSGEAIELSGAGVVFAATVGG